MNVSLDSCLLLPKILVFHKYVLFQTVCCVTALWIRIFVYIVKTVTFWILCWCVSHMFPTILLPTILLFLLVIFTCVYIAPQISNVMPAFLAGPHKMGLVLHQNIVPHLIAYHVHLPVFVFLAFQERFLISQRTHVVEVVEYLIAKLVMGLHA